MIFSTPLTIKADMALENIDIDFLDESPRGSEVILSGDFSLPEDYTRLRRRCILWYLTGKSRGRF
ncbi:MAG: hypothetical protein R2860_02165 [Desulfobacterales bacterium]